MRLIVHGTREQVTAITPGLLTAEVITVSDPYENRKGTPRLWRVYLDNTQITTPQTRELIGWLVAALENLGARITRDLDPDASEGTLPEDPVWAATLTGFLADAEQQLEVLNHPDVVALVESLQRGEGR